MFTSKGRDLPRVFVLEFQALREAMLQKCPYGDAPEMQAFKAFLKKHGIALGKLRELEAAHDQMLGPAFFQRPPTA